MNKFFLFSLIFGNGCMYAQNVKLGYVNTASISENVSCGVGEIFIIPEASVLKTPTFVNSSTPNYLENTATLTNVVPIGNFVTYPNPVNDKLYFHTTINVEQVNIYNLNGKLILVSTVQSDHSINLTSLKSGVYLIKSEQFQFPTVRIIKN